MYLVVLLERTEALSHLLSFCGRPNRHKTLHAQISNKHVTDKNKVPITFLAKIIPFSPPQQVLVKVWLLKVHLEAIQVSAFFLPVIIDKQGDLI